MTELESGIKLELQFRYKLLRRMIQIAEEEIPKRNWLPRVSLSQIPWANGGVLEEVLEFDGALSWSYESAWKELKDVTFYLTYIVGILIENEHCDSFLEWDPAIETLPRCWTHGEVAAKVCGDIKRWFFRGAKLENPLQNIAILLESLLTSWRSGTREDLNADSKTQRARMLFDELLDALDSEEYKTIKR